MQVSLQNFLKANNAKVGQLTLQARSLSIDLEHEAAAWTLCLRESFSADADWLHNIMCIALLHKVTQLVKLENYQVAFLT